MLITSFSTLASISATTANTIHGHEPQITSIPIVSDKRLTLLYQGVAYHQPFVIANSKPNEYDLGILPFVLADDYYDQDSDIPSLITTLPATAKLQWEYYNTASSSWQAFLPLQLSQSFANSGFVGESLRATLSIQAQAESQYGEPNLGNIELLSKTYLLSAYDSFAGITTHYRKYLVANIDFDGSFLSDISINVGFPYTGFEFATFYLKIPTGFGTENDYDWDSSSTHAGVFAGVVELHTKGSALITARGKAGTPASGKAYAYYLNPQKWYFGSFSLLSGPHYDWYDTATSTYPAKEFCAVGGGRIPARNELSNSPYADPITYPSATASLWLPTVNYALDIPSQQVVSSASQYSIAQDWGEPSNNSYGSSIPGGGLSLFTSETKDNVPDDSLTGSRFVYKTFGGVSTVRPNIYRTGVICIVD